jgi:hypothetical protein
MLFALPGAIAVPIIAGFLLGGPMLGFPLAALVAIVIVGSRFETSRAGGARRRPRTPPMKVGAAPRPAGSSCRWRSRWPGSSSSQVGLAS